MDVTEYLIQNYREASREKICEDTGLQWYQITAMVQRLRRKGIPIPGRGRYTSRLTGPYLMWKADKHTLLSSYVDVLVDAILTMRLILRANKIKCSPRTEDVQCVDSDYIMWIADAKMLARAKRFHLVQAVLDLREVLKLHDLKADKEALCL